MENLEHSILLLKEMINNSQSIVFFGGAGVSTESGIPDFRSKDGLYNMKYDFPPETILSHHFFMRNTAEFYKFYRDKLNSLAYEPNITHTKLASLEADGKLKAIVTQNIDGLHQKAGSKNVFELHGSVLRNYCMKCHAFYDASAIFYNTANSSEIPYCKCGGIIKPDVVLYEESLDDAILENSIHAIANCDLLIVGGTSLTVQPASSLVHYFRGKNLVLINRNFTSFDNVANLVIHDSLGNVFKNI